MTLGSSSAMKKAKRLYVSLSQSGYDLVFLLWLLFLESVLCAAIVKYVAYTEIDWEAYMQEVETWLSGELDYRNIRGSTGPLVYPAGFLYLYKWIRQISSNGDDVAQAQRIFICFYVFNASIVLAIYTSVARRMIPCQSRSTDEMQQAHQVWSWRVAMGLCCLSKRIHSIFVLRLFNDGPAMLLLHLAVLSFLRSKWRLGCVIFSLAVSIKMNILLFAPGLLLLLLQFPVSVLETIVCLAICASVQLVVGAPFLLSYPISYLRKAFELDRVFFYKWTVNWKFLSEDIFVSKPLSIILLFLHLGVLAFFCWQWLQSTKKQSNKRICLGKPLTPEYVAYTLFVSNFVGICFARTLHYQFYAWYFYSVPLLLWTSGTYPMWVRVVLVAEMEYSFNVFPATPVSSAMLQASHLFVLAGIRPPRRLNMNIIAVGKSKQP